MEGVAFGDRSGFAGNMAVAEEPGLRARQGHESKANSHRGAIPASHHPSHGLQLLGTAALADSLKNFLPSFRHGRRPFLAGFVMGPASFRGKGDECTPTVPLESMRDGICVVRGGTHEAVPPSVDLVRELWFTRREGRQGNQKGSSSELCSDKLQKRRSLMPGSPS